MAFILWKTALETYFLLTSPNHLTFIPRSSHRCVDEPAYTFEMASLPRCSLQLPVQAAAWTSSDSLVSGVFLNNNLLEMLLGSSYLWCFFCFFCFLFFLSSKQLLGCQQEIKPGAAPAVSAGAGKRKWKRKCTQTSVIRNCIKSLVTRCYNRVKRKREREKKTEKANNRLCANWIQTQEHFQTHSSHCRGDGESKLNTDWCIKQTTI